MAKNRSRAKFWQTTTPTKHKGKVFRKAHLHGVPCADVRPRREAYIPKRSNPAKVPTGIPARVTKGKA